MLGAPVGTAVGLVDGVEVGTLDGMAVGYEVGLVDGEAEGVEVGTLDGEEVGLDDGASEVVGEAVVDKVVGDVVGEVVGDAVGNEVLGAAGGDGGRAGCGGGDGEGSPRPKPKPKPNPSTTMMIPAMEAIPTGVFHHGRLGESGPPLSTAASAPAATGSAAGVSRVSVSICGVSWDAKPPNIANERRASLSTNQAESECGSPRSSAVSAVRAVFRHRYRSRRTLIQNPLFTHHRYKV